MEKFGFAKRSSASKSSANNAQRTPSVSSSTSTNTTNTAAVAAAAKTNTASHSSGSSHGAATTTTTNNNNNSGGGGSSSNSHNHPIPSTSSAGDVTSGGDDDVRGSTSSSPGGQAAFLHKVRQASEAVNAGDFRRAVQAYGQAIALDPSNHILYTNRSAALFKLARFADSVKDARSARDLNPKWAKAYLREGVALQQLGHHGDALAAFAAGLAQEPANAHLLSGLTDTALKSPLRDKFQATFQQLEKLRLGRSPFVLLAVVGQELLAASHYSAAVGVLESALQVGTCSLKLRGSVFSALASAHWGLGALDKAVYHMQQDLAVAKSLGDQEGECRAYGNLGSAFFSKGQYKESLTHHRFQLVLAMRLRHRGTAASALSSLGHVYTAIGDYPNALASHKQCVLLLKQSSDKLSEAREIGNVGAVYLAMGNFSSAIECHTEHLKMARALRSPVEEARAYSNLGSAHHYKRDYERALVYHKEVLKIAEQRTDKTLEARAYAGLGHAARCASNLPQARFYHEKQLDNALSTKDRVAEGRACANLGIIFHGLAEYEAAMKLHQKHLEIAQALGDKASQGRACGNMGNAYSALGKHEQAVKLHKQALGIAVEVNDCHSQGSTHGNLAVGYQSLGLYDNAMQHYVSHLNISRELKDMASEARALCNLGNFHCARGDHAHAVPFYEQYLVLSKELKDCEGESKACFNLGYAHFNLMHFTEAVHYYEQDLALARDRKDRLALARAYCNLGLARKSLGQLDEALECQKKCLRLMEALKNSAGKFRALGNIGDLMLKMGDTAEAVKIYTQQVTLARQADDQDFLATARGALGHAHRLLGQYDRALACHTQELTIRQESGNLRGECCAHGHLGNVHTSMGNYLSALKCYQEMLERSRELGSHSLEGQACGNLGITKMNLGQLEDAIGFFEQQLAMLEQQTGPAVLQEKARAFSNLGDCYEALGDFEEAVKWHEQCLIIAQQLGSLASQDKAYRGLGNAHKAVGNLQQALVCFEKRLYVAHQLSSNTAKASAYGELGCLHSLLGNFEQAVSCLEQQLGIARDMGDRECEGDAACGLGGVYQQMGESETALKYHSMDLEIAENIQNTVRQCRAYGNLGLSHESLGNYEEAVKYQEQHLSIAAEMNDKVAKTLAYSSLGRVHHALGRHTQAVQYLQQGLAIAEQQRRREDEAKIRHRLGLALLGCGQLEDCQRQLNVAADLFETIRRESQCSSDYKLSLFDLQTACYQALQRVLVGLGRHDEALVVAERACTRAFIDLLLERQAGSAGLFNGTTMDLTPVTIDQMTATVSRQRALVLCFSVAAGSLYSWLLTPSGGVVKFHEMSLSELDSGDHEGADNQSLLSFSSTSILDQCVGQVREAMGIESHIATTSTGLRSGRLTLPDTSDAESEADSEVFQQQLEELGGRLNMDSDRTGFLAMINRTHTFNSSAVSLGSILSLPGSATGVPTAQRTPSLKRAGGKSPLSTLYHCLIAPMEETIAGLTEGATEPVDLVLVLQGDLYLIPFLMLRADQTQPFLFERFNLIIVPSVTALHNTHKNDKGRPVIESSGALVVGNPQLTPSIAHHWHLKEIPGAEYEARILGELLSCRPLIGPEATKGAVLHQIEQVEVIHFAAHISWKLSSIVLSPCEFGAASASAGPQPFTLLDSDDSASDVSTLGSPSLSEYLLTAADVLNLRLHAKLVVLNSGYTDDRAGRVNTDGVVGLTRALLSAGAQCVLFSLWPVPDSASKLLMRTLYGALQDGKPITQALSKAIKTVQSTKQFSHPANWGGWVVVGQDIRLASKVALMGHALSQILHAATISRETMRVLLHLMEKSLQRIQQGARNPMYTTVQSIENKVGAVPGWKELLQAVGFRFEPATAGLPPAVFFPQSDPSDRLTQASASLQALLGLPPSSVTALSKFITNQAVGEALIQGMREILSKLSAKEGGIDMLFNVELWHVSGCHEFLASLGLDLVAVGAENVTLRLSKQAVRRHLQFALQALVAVFNTQDAPRTLSLDNSSSLESLSSCHSGSTPSTPSLSSPTPGTLSPLGRGKKSLFNPAEMERMRHSQRQQMIRKGRMKYGGGVWIGEPAVPSSPSPTASPRSPLQQDPALCLSHQSRIRSRYGSSSFADSPTGEADLMSPPLSSPSVEDSDSVRSGEAPPARSSASSLSLSAPRMTSVLRSSSSDSVTTKSVKFAEDLVTEQLFDPAGPRSDAESDSESVTGGNESGGGRTASQLRQHFERLSLKGDDPPAGGAGRKAVVGGLGGSGHRTKGVVAEECAVMDAGGDSGSGGGGEFERLDPEDIALKVLADVASQRAQVELMQRHSVAQSQTSSRRLRQHNAMANSSNISNNNSNSSSGAAGDDHTHHPALPSLPDFPSPHPSSHSHYHHHHQQQQQHLRHDNADSLPRGHNPAPSSSSSALRRHHHAPPLPSASSSFPPGALALSSAPGFHRTTPPAPPPPYTAPPSYSRHSPSPTALLVRGGGGSGGSRGSVGRSGGGGLQSGENSISSDNSEGADSNLQSSVSSGYHSENGHQQHHHHLHGMTPTATQLPADRGTFTQDFVNHSSAGAFAKPPPTSSSSPLTLPLRSAAPSPPRPAKPPSPLARTSALQTRPESTNSLSSQYSTSSSTRSVIYRPLGGGGGGGAGGGAGDACGLEAGPKSRPPPPASLHNSSSSSPSSFNSSYAPNHHDPAHVASSSSTRPRVSPIIRTPSASPNAALQGQGPPGRKKVSFSDSETPESGNTSFEDAGPAGVGGAPAARYGVSDVDASDYDSDTLTRRGKLGLRNQIQRLKAGSPSHGDTAAPHGGAGAGGVGGGGGDKAFLRLADDGPARDLGSSGGGSALVRRERPPSPRGGGEPFSPASSHAAFSPGGGGGGVVGGKDRFPDVGKGVTGSSVGRERLPPPPAVPPRRPLTGKDPPPPPSPSSVALQPRVGTAAFRKGPYYDPSAARAPALTSDPGDRPERAGQGPADARAPPASGVGGALPEGEGAVPHHHSYGQPVRLGGKSVPLFLDKERRSIAKSAVLQSSKC